MGATPSHLASVKPSPRVRIAATLFASGAAKTKKQAAEMAGLHPNYLTMLTNSGNEEVNRIISETQRMVLDNTIDTSTVLQALGRQALATIAQVMEASPNEGLKLKAAIDLADRAPETSKVVRAQVTSLTLDGEDAQRIAEALVKSANVRQQYQEISQGDFIRVDTSVATALPPMKIDG